MGAHTMTKVEFNFRKGGAEVNPSPIAANVVLKSIKISPVFNAGVLNVTYGDDVAFTWTPENTTEDYEYVALEDAYITNGDVTVFVPAYTELPEVAAEGAYCKVDNKVYQVVKVTGAETEELKWEEVNSAAFTSYSGKVLEATEGYTNYVTWYMIPQGLGDDQVVTITYIADGKTIVQDFALTVNNTTNKDWTEETCVKYNVTIAPHKITFTPSVNPWTEFDSDKDKEGNQDVEMEN